MKKLFYLLACAILWSCASKENPPVIKVVNLMCIEANKKGSVFVNGSDTLRVRKYYKPGMYHNIVIEAK